MAQPAAPTGATERADYGDDTAPREHPAIGVLRGVYRDIEAAVGHILAEAGRVPTRGVPTDIEVELRRAQALVAEVAGRLKEAA